MTIDGIDYTSRRSLIVVYPWLARKVGQVVKGVAVRCESLVGALVGSGHRYLVLVPLGF